MNDVSFDQRNNSEFGRGGRQRGRGRGRRRRGGGGSGGGSSGGGGGGGGGRRDQHGEQYEEAAPDLSVPADKTVIIGLTGEPGAGKSSLAREFTDLGAQLLDVDVLGHEVIEGPATKKKLLAAFGDDILGEDGAIDRAKLAAKAFADADSLAELNKIVHPQLSRKAKMALKKLGNFVVIDAALLHELGLAELCSQTVYVRAPVEARLARVAARDWDAAELARRDAALGDAEERRRASKLTVENSGDPQLLTSYAQTILARQLGIDLSAARRQAPPQAAPSDSGPDRDRDRDRDADYDQGPVQQQGNREVVHAKLDDYLRRTLPDLQAEAAEYDIRDVAWLKKHDLINEMLRRVAGGRQDDIEVSGWVELVKDQHGYLRSHLNEYSATNTDTFISGQLIRRYGIKAGMHLIGTARASRGNERCPQLLTVQQMMGEDIDKRTPVRPFQSLTPLHPTERLFMERQDQPNDYNLRIVDLVAPIGKGQRGLIVAQPKCGKTVYLQKIANAITTNNPEVTLLILLIDERPEEVTDMERHVQGEVIASTFDQPASRHVQVAEMAINKAKRLVEYGKDVVILMDSITRLARAYNAEAPSSGRIMSGGIEATALIKPKQFFGAARNMEEGGSLTILATALVDTGSVMDTVIFEEFKGTGNMELVLDRRLANKRIFPAVDVAQSGTRKDDLMIEDPEELKRLWALRRFLADRSSQDAIEFLKGKLKNYKSNIEFLMTMEPDKMTSWK